VSNSREALKGQPLTAAEREALALKCKGFEAREIAEIARREHRNVQEILLRARYKLGAESVGGAVAVFTEAQVLRAIVRGIDGVQTLEQLRAWQTLLAAKADALDLPTPEPMCNHGKHMVREVCEECEQEGTKHKPEPVRYIHPWNGQPMVRCTRCRRYPSNHYRSHREDKQP
jgi:DNA-binding CsgD family transcriptional regulator